MTKWTPVIIAESSPSRPSAEAFAQMSKLSTLPSVLLTSSPPPLDTAVQDLPGLVDVKEHFIVADKVPMFGHDGGWKDPVEVPA